MNSRERVANLLSGKPVDRIPNGLGGCETAGLHNLAYENLKNLLGVRNGPNRFYTFMNNAVFEPEVLSAMQGDIISLGSRMCPSRLWGPHATEQWKPQRLWETDLQVPTPWKFKREADGAWWWWEYSDWEKKCPAGAYYFDPLPDPRPATVLDNLPCPPPDYYNPSHELPEELLRRLEEDARWLYENTGYSIACGEMINDLQGKHGGMESWWMRMVSEPSACHDFLDRAVDAALSQLVQLDQAIGKYCAILGLADDMGDTRGVTVGPDLWRSIYKPHYKRLFTQWHEITSMKVNLHSCGSVAEILPDLVECGADILNPVQVSARGMEPSELKRLAGDRIVFYGGAFDAVEVAVDTDEEKVYERVRANILSLSEGGRYIFAGVHNLPADMPQSHLRAMLQAYDDCRCLPECRADPVERFAGSLAGG